MKIDRPFELLEACWYSALGMTGNLSQLWQDPSKLADNLAQIRHPEQLFSELIGQGKNVERDLNNIWQQSGLPKCDRRRVDRLPDYQVYGSEQVYPPPYELKETELYGFFVEGTMKNLQELCDRALNHPGSPVTYHPLSHYVMVTFDRVGDMRSYADRDRGYFSEREVVFWVLTVVGRKIGAFFQVERLAWFTPYIFVDSSAALDAGREVYGFPKQYSRVQISPEDTPSVFTLDTLMLKTFAPNTKAQSDRLLEIKLKNSDLQPEPIKTFESIDDVSRQAIDLLLDTDTLDLPGIGLPLKLGEYLIDREVPAVCFKQFRDAEDGTKACYQGIIEFPFQLTRFDGGKLLGFEELGHQYEFNIFNYASEPIVNDLGLHYRLVDDDLVQIPIKLSVQLNFDFRLDPGKVIWERR